ncbi:MAG: SRPBCC family protein [Flavobacteriales bacterium]|nr:SRPBCC family protein [Flavobacteriales bacterium]
MNSNDKERITVKAAIHAPIETVWEKWTSADHIVNWNFASDDWCCPSATSPLEVGARYTSRMEARDGSVGFDFWGTYVVIEPPVRIHTQLGDGRHVEVEFMSDGKLTQVTETFDPEDQNPIDLQRGGWQAILNNFKKYVENGEMN